MTMFGIDRVDITNHASSQINGDRINVPEFEIKNMVKKEKGMTFRQKDDEEGVYHQVKGGTTAVIKLEEEDGEKVAAVKTVYRKYDHKYKDDKFRRID